MDWLRSKTLEHSKTVRRILLEEEQRVGASRYLELVEDAEKNLGRLAFHATPDYKKEGMGWAYASRYHVPHFVEVGIFLNDGIAWKGAPEIARIEDINCGSLSASIAAMNTLKHHGRLADNIRLHAIDNSKPLLDIGRKLLNAEWPLLCEKVTLTRTEATVRSAPIEVQAGPTVFLACHPFPYPSERATKTEITHQVQDYAQVLLRRFSTAQQFVALVTVIPSQESFCKTCYTDALAELAEAKGLTVFVRRYNREMKTDRKSWEPQMAPLTRLRLDYKNRCPGLRPANWSEPFLHKDVIALLIYRGIQPDH